MDLTVFAAVQALAGESAAFDRVISNIAVNPILKGGLPMVLFWALWFSSPAQRDQVRAGLVAMLGVAAIALVAGRVLASQLPFRLRPLHAPGVEIQLSFDLDPSILSGWSAFPSDHAVMFFALAACFWQIRRGFGMVAVAHALVAIVFGRVFMGFHWPSDVLAGMLIGIALAVLLFRPLSRWIDRSGILRLCDRHEVLVYPLLFLITFQISTMFDALRSLAGAMIGAFALL